MVAGMACGFVGLAVRIGVGDGRLVLPFLLVVNSGMLSKGL